MTNEIKKCNENNNCVYTKNSDGRDIFMEFDINNNTIHYKSSSGFEYWKKFDESNNEIYCKNSLGEEDWWRYDEGDKRIRITEQEYKEIEFKKEFLSREEIPRFELMEL